MTNFYDHIGVPENAATLGIGVNVSLEHVSTQLVENLHANGKLVVVWIDTNKTKEGPEAYCRMLDLGIDSYCTDFPLEAQRVWENYQ